MTLRKIKFILTSFLAAMSFWSFGQSDILMAEGNNNVVITCAGEGMTAAMIYDNGGSGANYTYAPGTVSVLGLCPDVSGAQLMINLTSWDICQASPPFSPVGDAFFIFDGTADSLNSIIGSGSVAASAFLASNPTSILFSSLNSPSILAPALIGASPTNASGCLTLGFISSGLCQGGGAGFVGEVSCVGGILPTCNISLTNVQSNPCVPATNTFSVQIDYSATQTLGNDSAFVSLDGMVIDTAVLATGDAFFDVNNIPADGGIHFISVSYFINSGCNSEIQVDAPVGCQCTAAAGTLTNPTTSEILCSGETIQFSLNNDGVAPLDVFDPIIQYQPGVAWALYSALPTTSMGDITADPAFVSVITGTAQPNGAGGNITFTNDAATVAALIASLQLPAGFNAPITFYIAPVTMYDYLNGVVAVQTVDGYCGAAGQAIQMTMVPPINVNALPTSCAFSNAPFIVSEGTNAANPINFTLSNLSPATATFANASVSNGGVAQINNLIDGDNYSFTITDPNGCAAQASGGPFVGTQTPVINPVPSQCESSSATPLFATPAGGTWSGPGVVGSTFDPGVAGSGTWNIIYTVGGTCGGNASIQISVLQDQLCITGVEQAIGTPSIVACGGFLVDNGMTASDYSANLNDTSVICPDPTLNVDQITNLFFNVFDLGLGDQFFIYNGNSTNAPLIGQYSGIDLSGQNIYSTDASGCLTVVFESNSDASVGNISAEISCGIPCMNPVVHVTLDQPDFQPALICPGETVTFNASTTEFFNGGVYVSHEWQWDDGTTDTSSTTWPIVSHTFTDAGGYLVQLLVTDSNGCTNSVLPDILIFSATTPTIQVASSEADNQICTGIPLDLNASFQTHTWTDVPTANLGGALYIPDDQSQCFSDTLTFSGFDAGATIQSPNDILSLFINFEHSFMNDISISYTCPDGSMIVVHQNGGGGEFLGEPIDVEDPNQPGVGYDYYWSPTATNGTWAANAASNAGGTLAAGTYQSVQPFDNLVGCPLNGEWIIEVCDGWAVDDGFIFDWAVTFAPYMYPDNLTFTPTIGMACDSSYWTAPGGTLVSDVNNLCDSVSVINNTTGNFTYTYHLMDNHGCEYSQDLTINIYAAPVVDAGPVATYCGTPLIIPTPGVHNPLQNAAPGIAYLYDWSSAADTVLSSTSVQGPTITNLQESSYFTVSVTSVSDAACTAVDSVLVNVAPELPPHATYLDSVFCQNDEFTLQLPDIFVNNGYTFEWYFNPVPDSELYVQTPIINPSPTPWDYTIPSVFPTVYHVQVTDAACNFQDYYDFIVGADPCDVLIPNIFTPNGAINAGDITFENNTFYIEGLFYPGTYTERFPGSTLKIYNRWGTLVYESDSYRNDWTGADQSEGTYYYVFMQNFESQEPKFFEGYITLVR
jgi:subtilisin-like proprotein convertase family protein